MPIFRMIADANGVFHRTSSVDLLVPAVHHDPPGQPGPLQAREFTPAPLASLAGPQRPQPYGMGVSLLAYSLSHLDQIIQGHIFTPLPNKEAIR